MVLIKDYLREWKGPEEKSYRSKSFSLKHKPEERYILAKDKDLEHGWNMHFCCSGPKSLTEKEKEELRFSIIHYLKEGDYLTTSGTSTEEKENEFKKFSRRTKYFEDTGCVRVLHDKFDDHNTYFPILKKK